MANLLKLFSRFGAGSKPAPVKPAINLAAFGKHPGWDDHIPGIGLETETLAHLKQSFYVTGIGAQIDSGAWEKLEVAKRVEGFGHTFLWLRPGHTLLGQLWSSSDRKGRAKYPMVICTDSQGISNNWLLTHASKELTQLRGQCRTLTTAEPVMAECQTSQARLRALLESAPGAGGGVAIPAETWRRFLSNPLFGEQQVGLLRILHELADLQGSNNGRSRHLRVPVIGQSPGEIFQLWAGFFRGAVPGHMPLLLILRHGVDWLDVILGEPAGDEFFCLQASPLASPLATQVPYELKPELQTLLQKLTTTFLDPSLASPSIDHKRAEPSTQPGVASASGGTGFFQGGGKLPLVLFILAFALIGGAGWFFFHSRQPPLPVAASSKPVGAAPPVTTSPPAGAAQPPSASDSESQRQYTSALAAGNAALTAKNYDEAIKQAKAALDDKPGDSVATALQAQAEGIKRQMLAVQEAEQKFNAAMAAGNAALSAKNYDEAIKQAVAALANKPGDSQATTLRTQAESAKRQMLAVQAQERNYQTALAAGNVALSTKNYDSAIKSANLALQTRPNDSAALDLQKQAQAKLAEQTAVRQRQEQVNALLQAGQAAFDKKDYATAASKADDALDLMPESDSAMSLKKSARNQANYTSALTAGLAALAAKNHDEALNQARTALAINPAGPEALKLQAEASGGTDLEQVKALMKKPDAVGALAICNRHPNDSAFTTLAAQIRQAELRRIDDTLETYQVWFGLIKPDSAKSAMAKAPEAKKQAQELADVFFTGQVVTYYTDLVNQMESQLNAMQQLDAGRALIVKKLKKTIAEHP